MRTSSSVVLVAGLAAVLLVASSAAATPLTGDPLYYQVVVVLDETHGFDEAAVGAKGWSHGLDWLTGSLAAMRAAGYQDAFTQWGLVTADRSTAGGGAGSDGSFGMYEFSEAGVTSNWSDLDGLLGTIGDLAEYSADDTMFDGLKGLQYAALETALAGGKVMMLILATDDDWTAWTGGPADFHAMMNEVTQSHEDAYVNAIVDHGFSDGLGDSALGTFNGAPQGSGYTADMGRAGAVAYVDPAPASEWLKRFSLWDYSLAAGDAENEFREGFTDVKIQEITRRPEPDADCGGCKTGGDIPEPSTFVLLGVALGALVLVRRRRA